MIRKQKEFDINIIERDYTLYLSGQAKHFGLTAKYETFHGQSMLALTSNRFNIYALLEDEVYIYDKVTAEEIDRIMLIEYKDFYPEVACTRVDGISLSDDEEIMILFAENVFIMMEFNGHKYRIKKVEKFKASCALIP